VANALSTSSGVGVGVGAGGVGVGAGVVSGTNRVASPCSSRSWPKSSKENAKHPATPKLLPQELRACTMRCSALMPYSRNSWPPRTDPLIFTRPVALGLSKPSYQFTPTISGETARALRAVSRVKACWYPEMSPAFCAALATARPVDPVSVGG
jgi:hypothetical protein